MDNKEFARRLEIRTRQFAARIIRLSTKLPNTSEGKIVKISLRNVGLRLAQIIEKLIEPEVKRILEVELKFVKVKPVKPNIG